MKNNIGVVVIIIGVLHSLLGFVKHSGVFGGMLSNGLLNTGNTIERNLAFWFTFAGITFMLLGYLIKYIESQKLAVPITFGWLLLGAAVVGVVILPISGFWALFLPAILIIYQAKSGSLAAVDRKLG
ncbi:hypothetical protein BKI52_38750 [marine bacterium AO1-C]|nr:hypothetical protein BKI52_38750 [marine bacterium AO1-C]